ncbi:ABC-type transport auxiliary lipoprotein family protein [Desulfovibrio inopinatus]|uniref:ABC-type transport auxiliary lipoprotein family protein n=1 Tax=Desulfovibrio inopinatus TaxID=102109 RepID=UPI00042493B8|nr:ABC-type transport auxiliary lipoprotein family protein [Desulfovibrio inopinatus]
MKFLSTLPIPNAVIPILRLFLLCCLCVGGGCTFLKPGPAPDVYGLMAQSEFPSNLPTLNTRLLIDEPSAVLALNNNRIAVKTTAFNYRYLGKARWMDRAPAMVQALLLRSFQNTNAIMSVEDVAVGYTQDYELSPELWDFQAEVYDGTPHVTIRLVGRILDRKQGRILALKTFTATQTMPPGSATDSADVLVPAFNAALSIILQETVVWTIDTLATLSQTETD